MARTKKIPAPKINEMPVVVLTADTLINLIRRVDELARRVEAAENTAQENFDILVEHIPTVTDDGVKVKAFAKSGEGYEIVTLGGMIPSSATGSVGGA